MPQLYLGPASRRGSLGSRETGLVIWSGAEFEEHLRLRAEFLLRRLVEGVPFPDSEVELRSFVDKLQDVDDD